jgi:hypothetical protein
MHRPIRALAVLGAALLLAALPTGAALAHVDHEAGDLTMVVGFGDEPAYAGLPNSVEVLLTHGDEPVTDLRRGDLRVEIGFGDETTEMDLEPNFLPGVYGEPGDYRAWFVPSQPGPYTFRIFGEIEGEEIDEPFTSGPDTFSEAHDPADASFPEVDAPSSDELATRIEQEAGRTADAVATAEARVIAAEDDASSARTIALIALVAGALGVIAGIAGIVRGRRSA